MADSCRLAKNGRSLWVCWKFLCKQVSSKLDFIFKQKIVVTAVSGVIQL